MNKYKIAVYAICKNEEKFTERWLSSMSEADEIYVTDTGSSDSTVKKLKEGGAVVNTAIPGFWRFDDARNISLSFVPSYIDICVCTDLDEIFESGWRELVENVWQKDVTKQLRYMYTWSFNKDGSPGVKFWYEKIHSRNGFRWVNPVHEILQYCGSSPHIYAEEGRIQLNHYPDPEKSRGQYLPLLKLSVKENPHNDRNVHYLGREYMFYKMWDNCIETLKHHLQMPEALWKDERCASMRYIARAYKEKNDFKSASSWLFKAIAEAPYLKEPYIEAAQLAYLEKDWLKMYYMIKESLKISQESQTYISETFCRDHTVYDLGAICCYNLGFKEEALDFAKKACLISPDDERLKKNLEFIKGQFENKSQ